MTTTGKSLTQLIQERIDFHYELSAGDPTFSLVTEELRKIQTALNEVIEYCEQEWMAYLGTASREKDFALSVAHQTRADAYRDMLVKLKGDKI